MGATTYLVPAITVLMSWAVLGQVPSWLAIVGGAMCLVGVALSRRRHLSRASDAAPRLDRGPTGLEPTLCARDVVTSLSSYARPSIPTMVDEDLSPVQPGSPGPARRRQRAVLGDGDVQRATVGRLSHLALGADEAVMLDDAVRAVADALHVEIAGYFELTPSQDALVLRAAVGWPSNLVGAARVPAGEHGSYAGFVIAAGRPVVVRDLRTEARFTSPLLTGLGVVSGVSAVVYRQENKPLGVLCGQTRTLREFTADEAAFLQTIANVVSVGILRRRGEARLQKLVQSFERPDRRPERQG